jgi:hypothetical protein
MASLSSYYPQPVIAGTTAGTYAEGDDSRISQLGAGSVVTSTGSGTARSIADRFSESCNVLDYGADPTGNTDSWLAIQRAVAAAGGHPVHGQDVMNKNVPANTETTLTSGTPFTFDFGGKTIPQLFYTDRGDRIVYFPKGIYRVSRPIVTGVGTKLVGGLGGSGNGPVICPTIGSKGQFNLIESYFVWLNRTQCDNNVPWQIKGGYDNNVVIEGLTLQNNYGDNYAVPPVRVNGLHWYRMPFGNSGVGGASFPVTADATSGNNYFTPTGTLGSHRYYPDQKIKFSNHSTVYTYVKRNSNQIFVTPNITESVSGANVLIGFPANNGILINGGENAIIQRCYVNGFEGAGIFVLGGTPAPVIAECMVSFCDVGYWMEGGTNLLLQPSGDGNNVFLRTGYIGAIQTLMQGCKVEGKHSLGVSSGFPYPYGSDARSGIEIANYGTVSGTFTFIGGGWNYHGADAGFGQTNSKNHAFISCYRESFMPKVQVYGMRGGGFRETFYKQVAIRDPSGVDYGVDRILKRRNLYDYDDITTIQGTISLDYVDDTTFDKVSGTRINHRIAAASSELSEFAFYGDQGSGYFDGLADFSRSGTTATFNTFDFNGTTPKAHNLQVGDQIRIQYPAGVTPLTLDTNPENRGTYGSLYVKTTPSSTQFTCTVADSGGTGGVGTGVRLQLTKVYWLHGLSSGEHILQLPTPTPINATKVALSIRDKKFSRLAGLRVPTDNTGDWWANNSLNIGGTIDSPSSRILTGTGAPSASAPNGSIYLRTDGDPSSTVYVRAGDQWRPLGAYEP